MDERTSHDRTRRRFLGDLTAMPYLLSGLLLPGRRGAAQGNGMLTPTPACGDDDDDDPTPAQTEGPFFTPRSPERSTLLEPGMQGVPLVVSGLVLTRTCRPLVGALVDFWQANNDGAYDNEGYRLRGHQFTDVEGRYRLETIVPGLYPGRTRHIHVKVQAPDRPVLTTQLYFPGEAANARDRIFDPELVMELEESQDRRAGLFDFVLDMD